jgi:hypothetical protein
MTRVSDLQNPILACEHREITAAALQHMDSPAHVGGVYDDIIELSLCGKAAKQQATGENYAQGYSRHLNHLKRG